MTMEARTEGTETKRRGGKGRVTPDKQEQVEQPKVIAEKIDQLVKLKTAADEAATDFAEAVKAAAEKSGLLASVVRRFVVARSGEKFEEKKRECEQLSILFEEVGE
jgi:hypothetical protein